MHVSFNDISSLDIEAEISQSKFEKEHGRCTPGLIIKVCDGQRIYLDFATTEQLITFCEKHNFPVKDQRNDKPAN